MDGTRRIPLRATSKKLSLSLITHTLPLLIATPETLHSDYRIGWGTIGVCRRNATRIGRANSLRIFIPAATGALVNALRLLGTAPAGISLRSAGSTLRRTAMGLVFRWIASASLMLITGLVLVRRLRGFSAGMQKSRSARHALLRRQQRSGRRHARPIRDDGRTRRRSSSPIRRSKIRRSIRTCSVRSPIISASAPPSA